jgi:S1-C subfamily serine protease
VSDHWDSENDPWATPQSPYGAASNKRGWHPAVTGLIGLALGAALAVPLTLSHRTTTTDSAPLPGTGRLPSSSSSDVADQVDRSIVDITSRLGYQRAVAAGTGMVLTANGDVLTNNHVIEGATSITATSVLTGETYTATVVGTDPTQDVAVIRLARASNLTPITIGISRVGVGDPVVALGNAGGVGGVPDPADGFVTALDQQITATDSNGSNPQHLTGLIETDAPIRPGDSGGPLANTRAQVIGMDTAASASGSFGSGSSRGFAIPIQHAVTIAHEIETGQASTTVHIGPRGMIGVSVADVSTSGGALVQSVTSGSPAAGAGIHAGDTITAIDGQAVRTSTDLGTLVKAHGAGDRVTVSWTTAAGADRSSKITLAAGPPD